MSSAIVVIVQWLFIPCYVVLYKSGINKPSSWNVHCNSCMWSYAFTKKITRTISFVAIYLTIIMTICGVNLLIQLLLMNMYHARLIRPLPKWMKIVRNSLAFLVRIPSRQVQEMYNAPILTDDLKLDLTIDSRNTGTLSSKEKMDLAAIKELRILSKKVQSTEEQTRLIEEWKLAAIICNSFFFYLSVSVQVTILIICFITIPAVTK